MVRAVIIGCEQPRRSVLIRRRWIRRLRLANCRRMIVFTRNSSAQLVGDEVALLPKLPQTPGDFEFFHASAGRNCPEYACLRSSGLEGPKLLCLSQVSEVNFAWAT